MEGLIFLIDVGERLAAQKLDLDDEVSGFYSFPDEEFQYAVEQGRVELLGEIIKRTGAGLPLEHLVKHTGVEVKEKPRYYQGLTVYGKKRYVVAPQFCFVISYDPELSAMQEGLGSCRACRDAEANWYQNFAAPNRGFSGPD